MVTRVRPADFDSADAEMSSTLDNLDGADRYADWIVSLIAPHVSGRILEVGAGHGTFSRRLASLGDLTVSEPSPRAFALLQEKLADLEGVHLVAGDARLAAASGSFDGIVLVNVLEHIEDEGTVLRDLHDGLRPGGRVAIYVPAFELLYSPFDAKIGHFRRYRRKGLRRVVEAAGLRVVDLRYVNSIGFFAWLLTARLLRLTPTAGPLTSAYDRFVVPVLRRVEGRWRPPFGQSLLVVGERP